MNKFLIDYITHYIQNRGVPQNSEEYQHWIKDEHEHPHGIGAIDAETYIKYITKKEIEEREE